MRRAALTLAATCGAAALLASPGWGFSVDPVHTFATGLSHGESGVGVHELMTGAAVQRALPGAHRNLIVNLKFTTASTDFMHHFDGEYHFGLDRSSQHWFVDLIGAARWCFRTAVPRALRVAEVDAQVGRDREEPAAIVRPVCLAISAPVQHLVDRLAADPHRCIVGEIDPQPIRDLLRAPRRRRS